MERHATRHVLPPAARPAQSQDPAARPAAERTNTARVHVVGADPLARVGIRTLRGGHPGIRVTGESARGPQLAAALRTHAPQVLVVHGALSGEQQGRPATDTAGGAAVLVLGGARCADGHPAPAHAHLPATATAPQLAAAGCILRPAAAGRPAGPAPRLSFAGADELTERECEVLELLAHGLSNGEIGRSLTLSEHTVKTHVQNMLHKLRLRNRIHAVVYAFEAGLRRPR